MTDQGAHVPVDHAGAASMSEAEFAAELAALVADERPELFALCEEQGERLDGWVFAWGAAFEELVVLFAPNGRMLGTFGSVEGALRLFGRRRKLRLLWAGQESETTSA